MQNPDINIKMIREIIKGKHHYTPSYRKAQKGRRKAFRMVYGDFKSSFKALPRYMAALQLFNPGTIIEWEHHSTAIPYLDHTDENAEDFIYTRDDGSIRTAL